MTGVALVRLSFSRLLALNSLQEHKYTHHSNGRQGRGTTGNEIYNSEAEAMKVNCVSGRGRGRRGLEADRG
jgi:hypothetical protein